MTLADDSSNTPLDKILLQLGPYYSALLFSLETMWPRILGQLQAAAKRQSLETGKQEGGGRHFPLASGNDKGFWGNRRLRQCH